MNQTICCFQVNSQLALCSPKSCACTIEISSDPGTDSPYLILLCPLSHIWTLMEELGNQAPIPALKIPVLPSKEVGKQGFTCSIKTERDLWKTFHRATKGGGTEEGRAEGWEILEISQAGVKTCRELGEVPHLWKMGQDHWWIGQCVVPRPSLVFPYTMRP